MRTAHVLPLILFLLILATACSDSVVAPADKADEAPTAPVDCSPRRAGHATGAVDLVWRGNGGPGDDGDSTRVAAAALAMHEADGQQPDRGSFVFSVHDEDGTVHRAVTARISGVAIASVDRRVWFVGTVVADTKGCAGGPGGGHDDGCAGDDGGCSDGHDDGHDGGCSGDHEEGGCNGGGGGGGCPDGSHDDGGCPDGSHDDGGMPGGPAGATGRGCRVGQVIVGKAHDGGAPGQPTDGITWKWFLADDPDLPSIDDLESWPHLCRKTITGGNLTVHAGRNDDYRNGHGSDEGGKGERR